MQNKKTYKICITNGFESTRDSLTNFKKEAKGYSEPIGLKPRADGILKSSDFAEFEEKQEVEENQKMKKRQEKKSRMIGTNKDSTCDWSDLTSEYSKDLEEMNSVIPKTQKIKELIHDRSLQSLENGLKHAGISRNEFPSASSIKFTSSSTKFSHLSITNEGVQ